jgi:single-stranded-DNA-specific exonuclease
MPRKQWLLNKNLAEHRHTAQQLAQDLELPAFAAMLALGRGIDEEELPGFLGLAEEPLVNPYDLPDMDAAVERIELAIARGEKITVFGDYDADGVSATALLTMYLQSRSEHVTWHIPNRQTEGYGLTMGAIDQLHEQGTQLIVTVDNGVAAVREIAHAKALGMDTVVTDHHQCSNELPLCCAVVNPHRQDCNLPFKEYTGVAVAFLLVCALEGSEPEELLPNYAELVALGTIADVAPLLSDNRVFAREGLHMLNSDPGLPFAALLRVANAQRKPYGTSAFSFTIAPRINAAGRMGLANEALELLLCRDETQAEKLAQRLDIYNQDRQLVEQEIFAQATAWLEANPARQHDRVLVFAGEGWHEGVVGIVAARLLERTGKPVLMITQHGEQAKGSGRSIPSFHLFHALQNSAHLMQKFGGHELAAGFSLPSADVNRLREEINAYAANIDMPFLTQHVDCKLKPASLTADLADELALLEPFGQGNPQPVFALPKMNLIGITPVGEAKHLRLTLEQNGAKIMVMAFRTTIDDFTFAIGDALDLAVTLEANEFRGQRDVSLILKNAKFTLLNNEKLLQAERTIEQILRREDMQVACPTREDGAVVFRALKSTNKPVSIERILLQAQPEQFTQLWLAAEVLRELGLAATDAQGRYFLTPCSEKTPWEQAPLVKFLAGA